MRLHGRVIDGKIGPSGLLAPSVTHLIAKKLTNFLTKLFKINNNIVVIPLRVLLLKRPVGATVRADLNMVIVATVSTYVNRTTTNGVLVLPNLVLNFKKLVKIRFDAHFLPGLSSRLMDILFQAVLTLLSLCVFIRT